MKTIRDFPDYTIDRNGVILNKHGKRISPKISQNGYPTVCLYRDKKRSSLLVHRLVAIAFCDGEADGLTVDHIDMDKLNCKACNLEWVTHAENNQRACAGNHCLIDPAGAVHYFSNVRKFAREMGIVHSGFVRLLNGKHKSYKGWKLNEKV